MSDINILIVDDIDQNRYALKQIMNSEDFSIYEASSGHECLQILLNKRINILLLDIQMPQMDGFEVASFVRSNPKTKEIPIIFITAATQTDQIDLEGYQSGAIDIIYKPINKIILKQKVNILVELIRVQEKLKEKVRELTILNEENIKMRKRIETYATTDYLTQLYNRRALDSHYDKYFKNAIRTQTPICVLMIDLDHFKSYNDYFGHQRGDDALKIIAQVLKDCIGRPLDTIGRYGGEEFMIILPNTDIEGGKTIAQKLLNATKEKKIKQTPSVKSEVLTLSIGIAEVIPNMHSNKHKLIEQADKNLYKAKAAGRDTFR